MGRRTAEEVRRTDGVVKRMLLPRVAMDVGALNARLETLKLPPITNWREYRKAYQSRCVAKRGQKQGKKVSAGHSVMAHLLQSKSGKVRWQRAAESICCYMISRQVLEFSNTWRVGAGKNNRITFVNGSLRVQRLRDWWKERTAPLMVSGETGRVEDWKGEYSEFIGKKVSIYTLLHLCQLHPVAPPTEKWTRVGNTVLGLFIHMQARLRGNELQTWLESTGYEHNCDPDGIVRRLDREHFRETFQAAERKRVFQS